MFFSIAFSFFEAEKKNREFASMFWRRFKIHRSKSPQHQNGIQCDTKKIFHFTHENRDEYDLMKSSKRLEFARWFFVFRWFFVTSFAFRLFSIYFSVFFASFSTFTQNASNAFAVNSSKNDNYSTQTRLLCARHHHEYLPIRSGINNNNNNDEKIRHTFEYSDLNDLNGRWKHTRTRTGTWINKTHKNKRNEKNLVAFLVRIYFSGVRSKPHNHTAVEFVSKCSGFLGKNTHTCTHTTHLCECGFTVGLNAEIVDGFTVAAPHNCLWFCGLDFFCNETTLSHFTFHHAQQNPTEWRKKNCHVKPKTDRKENKNSNPSFYCTINCFAFRSPIAREASLFVPGFWSACFLSIISLIFWEPMIITPNFFRFPQHSCIYSSRSSRMQAEPR